MASQLPSCALNLVATADDEKASTSQDCASGCLDAINILVDKEVEDIFRCPVCILPYHSDERIPKMLPCHHTFCLPCLQSIDESQRQSRGHMECPVCRMQMSSNMKLEELTTNFYLNSFKELLNRKVSATSSSREPDSSSDGACASQEGLCSLHGGAPRRLWCKTCEQPICGLCQTSDHGSDHGHHVTSIENQKEMVVNNTLDLLTDATETVNELRVKISNLSEIQVDAIDACIAKLMHLGSDVRRKLDDTMDFLSEAVLDLFCSEIEELKSVLTSVDGVTVGEILQVRETVLTTTIPTLAGLVDQIEKVENALDMTSKLQVILCLQDNPRSDSNDAGSSNDTRRNLYCAFCGRRLQEATDLDVVAITEDSGESPPADGEDSGMFGFMCEFCNCKVIEV